MANCTSCGIALKGGRSGLCPECAAAANDRGDASLAPIGGAMLGLLGLLLIALGAVAWHMPAGKWLAAGGAVIIALAGLIVLRSVRRSPAVEPAPEAPDERGAKDRRGAPRESAATG